MALTIQIITPQAGAVVSADDSITFLVTGGGTGNIGGTPFVQVGNGGRNYSYTSTEATGGGAYVTFSVSYRSGESLNTATAILCGVEGSDGVEYAETVKIKPPNTIQITIETPDDGAVIGKRITDFIFTVTNAADNMYQGVEVFVDGSRTTFYESTKITGGYRYVGHLPIMAEGNHTLVILATDQAGNTKEKHITVKVEGIVVTIIRPQDSALVTAQEMELVFRATAAEGLGISIVEVTVNGKNTTAVIGDGYGNYRCILALQAGENAVQIRVCDSHKDSKTVDMTLRLVEGPVITMEAPKTTELTLKPGRSMEIAFAVSDTVSELREGGIYMDLNGEEVKPQRVESTADGFRYFLTLYPTLEEYRLTIRAWNRHYADAALETRYHIQYKAPEGVYDFVDTVEHSDERILPAEALRFNGKWIEEEIPGYRTLYVSGRELMASEIEDFKVGRADGMCYKGRRYPARTITVTYQLIAESHTAFREAYNKLNALLSTENAQLVFRDEPDKFFIGTKSSNSEVEPGRDRVTGEIEFYCADPFKYSVEEKAVTLASGNDTLHINYTGTREAYPKLEVKFNGDNGFMAFINQSGKILQFGNPEEVDKKFDASEDLVAEAMRASGTGRLWNNAILDSINPCIQQGSFKYTSRHGEPCIEVDDYGTPRNDAWYGPSLTRGIPLDSAGDSGSQNCLFGWTNFFVIDSAKDIGMVQFALTGNNGKNIASMTFAKMTQADYKGICKLVVNGKQVYQTELSFDSKNPATNWEHGWSYIQKFGGKIAFKVGDVLYQSFSDDEIKDVKATRVSFFCGAWGGLSVKNNGVRRIRFTKHNVQGWVDVPNKFSRGDVLVADCKTGSVLLNKISEPGLGAIGNNWEDFCLVPGNNQIRCLYSGWAKKPEITLKYREVYL